jgi:hypothetical protein
VQRVEEVSIVDGTDVDGMEEASSPRVMIAKSVRASRVRHR